MDSKSLGWALDGGSERGKSGSGRVDQTAELELAILNLRAARKKAEDSDDPRLSAELALELGSKYSARRQGSRADNLKLAVAFFSEALAFYDRRSSPIDWVICHSRLGKAYFDLSDGRDRSIRRVSILHYKLALAGISKRSWPELWHKIHLELSLLFKKYSLFSENDADATRSRNHYRIAFDMDKEANKPLYKIMARTYACCSKLFLLQIERNSERSEH